MNGGRVGVAVLASTLLMPALSACTVDQGPTTEPTPTAPPSIAADPTPALPAATAKRNAEGASAFVRYWIELLNFATATGTTVELKRFSDGRCTSCRAAAEKIELVYSRGGDIESHGWVVGDLDVSRVEGSFLLRGQVTMSPQSVRTSAGARTQRFPGGSSLMTFQVQARRRGWDMIAVTRAS
jgi:hypothetical protein